MIEKLKRYEVPTGGEFYWCADVDPLLAKAREIAMWHVGDGDECGQLARDLLDSLPADGLQERGSK